MSGTILPYEWDGFTNLHSFAVSDGVGTVGGDAPLGQQAPRDNHWLWILEAIASPACATILPRESAKGDLTSRRSAKVFPSG